MPGAAVDQTQFLVADVLQCEASLEKCSKVVAGSGGGSTGSGGGAIASTCSCGGAGMPCPGATRPRPRVAEGFHNRGRQKRLAALKKPRLGLSCRNPMITLRFISSRNRRRGLCFATVFSSQGLKRLAYTNETGHCPPRSGGPIDPKPSSDQPRPQALPSRARLNGPHQTRPFLN